MSAEPFTGEITAYGFDFSPRGWSACNGALLAISSNTALFSLLGTNYGGDGRSTMGLPDLRGRTAIGNGQGVGLSGHRIGQRAGVENNTLNVSQMPAHTHGATFTPTSAADLSVTLEATTDEGNSKTPSAGAYLARTVAEGGPQDKPESIYKTSATASTLVELGGVTVTGSASGGGDVTIATTGGNQSVSNMQPYLALNYCISLQGLYPSRT